MMYKETDLNIDNLIYRILPNNEAAVIGNELEQICNLSIPDTFIEEGVEYVVTVIGEQAFKDCQYLEAVMIPSSIKLIGREAFRNSSIEILVFDQGVLDEIIFEEAVCLDAMRLEYVSLPNSLEELPSSTFQNCQRLYRVEIGNKLKSIGDACFYNCVELKHFDFQESIEEYGDYCFLDTDITYAEIGPNVVKVGINSFISKHLNTIVILQTKFQVSDWIIDNNSRVTVYLRGNEESKDIQNLKKTLSSKHHFIVDNFDLVSESGIKYIVFSDKTAQIINYLDREMLCQVTIPESIDNAEVIGFDALAFKGSFKLVEIELPKTIKSIKGKVFEDCKNLKKVTFNHSISLQESRWVVSNENVTIVTPQEKDIKRFKVLIEVIHTLVDIGVTTQKTFNKIFDAYTIDDALIMSTTWCERRMYEYNKSREGLQHNEYRVIGILEE